MEQMIIEERGKQIMAGSHRVGIPGQVKVDICHRNDLGMAPTGPSSLHSKHRTERWLPESQRGSMPQP